MDKNENQDRDDSMPQSPNDYDPTKRLAYETEKTSTVNADAYPQNTREYRGVNDKENRIERAS